MKKPKLIKEFFCLGFCLIFIGNICAETEPVKAVDQGAFSAELTKGFEWYAYSAPAPKRFKYMGEVNYIPAREGCFYKGVLLNNKLYLQNTDGIILEPHSEIKFDFSNMVTPVKEYFSALEKKIENSRKQLDKETSKLKDATGKVNSLKKELKNLNSKKTKKNEKKTANELKNLKSKISAAEKKKDECQGLVNNINEEYLKIQKKYKELNLTFNKLSKDITK